MRFCWVTTTQIFWISPLLLLLLLLLLQSLKWFVILAYQDLAGDSDEQSAINGLEVLSDKSMGNRIERKALIQGHDKSGKWSFVIEENEERAAVATTFPLRHPSSALGCCYLRSTFRQYWHLLDTRCPPMTIPMNPANSRYEYKDEGECYLGLLEVLRAKGW